MSKQIKVQEIVNAHTAIESAPAEILKTVLLKLLCSRPKDTLAALEKSVMVKRGKGFKVVVTKAGTKIYLIKVLRSILACDLLSAKKLTEGTGPAFSYCRMGLDLVAGPQPGVLARELPLDTAIELTSNIFAPHLDNVSNVELAVVPEMSGYRLIEPVGEPWQYRGDLESPATVQYKTNGSSQ